MYKCLDQCNSVQWYVCMCVCMSIPIDNTGYMYYITLECKPFSYAEWLRLYFWLQYMEVTPTNCVLWSGMPTTPCSTRNVPLDYY